MKLPSGAIIILAKGLKEALSLAPDGVMLTPQAYQALLKRIEQLEAEIKNTPAETPTACRLSGQVEGDHARLAVQFDFRTERPHARVNLGCQRGVARPGALMDGSLPLLTWSDDGLVVIVEKPGVHRLTLDLEAPVASKGLTGAQQGFDLGLPRAAITIVEQIVVPASIHELRVNGRSVAVKAVDAQQARIESLPLGPAASLAVVWKTPPAAPAIKGPVVAEASARMTVRVEETRVTTDADLSLFLRSGATREWQVQFPAGVTPEIHEKDERIESIEFSVTKGALMIRLKEPGADPIHVHFVVRQPAARPRVAIGPFAVRGAVVQRGTIRVTAPDELRLRYQTHGDLIQRDTEDNRRETSAAEFEYWNVSLATHAESRPAPSLEIEAEPVQGFVETRADHELIWQENAWRAATKVRVTPIHRRVDALDFTLPAGYQYRPEIGVAPSELVERFEIREPEPGRRLAHVQLREQSEPFTLSIPGSYPLAAAASQCTLLLPRPVGTLDRGGQVTALLPETLEFADGRQGADAPAHRRTWSFERMPEQVELAWRTYHPEFRVEESIDLELTADRALVRQQMTMSVSREASPVIALRILPALAGTLSVEKGGVLGPNGTITLSSSGDKETVLALRYTFPFPTPSGKDQGSSGGAAGATNEAPPSRPFKVPLVLPRQATRLRTKVRVWAEPESLVSLAAGPWNEQPAEAVSDQPALPSLVLESDHLAPDLVLRITRPLPAGSVRALLDRAVIEAAIGRDGSQFYRARFLIRHARSPKLEIRLPGTRQAINAQFFLNGKRLSRRQLTEAGGNDGTSVLLVDLESRAPAAGSILEVRYQVSASEDPWPRSSVTHLVPPRLADDVFVAGIDWEVGVPSDWVIVSTTGCVPGEQQWRWRGGLFAPRNQPGVGESGFQGTAAEPDAASGAVPAKRDGLFEARAPGLEPIALVHAPERGWLTASSLTFLAGALALAFSPLPRRGVWWLVGAIALAAVFLEIWRPRMAGAIFYGCEPGVLALALVLALQWLVHRRYRQRVVFLPTFARGTGSSWNRKDGSQVVHHEPSTVDAPPKRDSSAK